MSSPQEALLREFNIEYDARDRSSGRWLALRCPWCHDEEQHAAIKDGKNWLYCWRCGGHPLADSVAKLSTKPEHEVRTLLRQLLRDTDVDILRPIVKRANAPDAVKWPAQCHDGLGHAHAHYLKKIRGFKNPRRIAALWSLRSTDMSERGWSWRIVAPFFIPGEESAVACQGRTLSDAVEPRYRSLDDERCVIPVKHLLYGEDLVPGESVIVVEGPIDAWKVGPGAVSCSGTGWTREQLMRLSRFSNRFICFDNEPTAQEKAEELAATLSALDGKHTAVGMFSPDEAKDFGELPEEEAWAFRRELLGT